MKMHNAYAYAFSFIQTRGIHSGVEFASHITGLEVLYEEILYGATNFYLLF
jgi:hypothetical protein